MKSTLALLLGIALLNIAPVHAADLPSALATDAKGWTDLMPSAETGEPAPPTVDPALLSRLIGQGRFVGRDVVLVLSPPEVQFYPLHLPDQAMAQPPQRIEQALKWEVAQESRSAAEDLEVRFWKLPRGRGQQANVMAVVMPAKTALQWCELLQRQHLTIRRIDVSPCALVRLARRMWTPADNDLWGVLDLGLRHSTLTVVVGEVPTYIRSISASAHQWTRQLAAAFEVGYPVAEQIKRAHTLQPTERGLRTAGSGRNLQQASDMSSAFSSVLREPLHALAQDVGRCFSYVMQSYPDHSAKRLLLAGGGADLGGLPALLEAELGLAVTPLANGGGDNAPPWEHILRDVRLGPRAAAAFGSAILDMEAA